MGGESWPACQLEEVDAGIIKHRASGSIPSPSYKVGSTACKGVNASPLCLPSADGSDQGVHGTAVFALFGKILQLRPKGWPSQILPCSLQEHGQAMLSIWVTCKGKEIDMISTVRSAVQVEDAACTV